MAKVLGGIGAALSGKVEEMVYVQFNGGVYTRKAPVRTKNSWSPAMLLHQKRFGEVSRFCKQFKQVLIPQIWNPAAVRMSGYALFLKTNMPAFSSDGSFYDPRKLQFSTGKLPLPQGFQAHRKAGEPTTIEVSWEKDLVMGGIHLKDELMVISAAGGMYSEITATGIIRHALHGSFELPSSPMPSSPMPYAPSPMHIYLFFASADRKDYSASLCFEV